MLYLMEVARLVGNMRLLVVDDDPSYVNCLSSVLEQLFREVRVFSDGKEALRHYRKSGGYDLVITDGLMPGLDGLEMIRELKNSELVPFVILLTASREPTLHREAELLGVDQILLKPIQCEEMMTTLFNIGSAFAHPVDDFSVQLFRERFHHIHHLERGPCGQPDQNSSGEAR